MITSVNLYFDRHAEDTIMSLWDQLAKLQIGRCMSCNDGRPHITLAIYNDLDESDVERAKELLDRLAGSIPAFALKFLQIGIFPNNLCAVFLTPNLSDELFHIHRCWHELFKDYADQCWDYYKPQNWYPHCTLSMETPTEQIPRVLEEILKDFRPFTLTVESIGLSRLQPIEYLYEVCLTKTEDS